MTRQSQQTLNKQDKGSFTEIGSAVDVNLAD